MALARADALPLAVHRSGNGPPVVLLHCLGVDHRFWDFAAGLADEFTLLRYDLPGHGATPVPAEPYDIADLSQQLAGLFRRHDLTHAHLVGISLGGLVAQHFAATWPGLVDRLVLIDTTPRYTDELRQMWAERAATARSAGVAAMVDGLLNIWFTPQFVAANGPAVRYVRTTLSRTSGEGYALACAALAAADLRPLAPQIAAPTLVLCGADDIASFLDAARWLAGNIRGARLAWLPGARHASVLERPTQAVELMREFLKES
jgi:3-oxoadipate enol-lactonase